MSKTKPDPAIRLRGVRHNNLKGFDLDLPLNRLIVITGLSGSGKSSLAFDTLYAEGQRRYIETFSPYTRQFFDRMDKPRVDSIEGIPPAIAIEQRNTVKTTRSTVGTMTEICEHMKQAWPLVATLFCRQCQRPVTRESPQKIWETIQDGATAVGAEILVTFDLPLTGKLSLKQSLELIGKQGYQRLLVDRADGPLPAHHRSEDPGLSLPDREPVALALRETTMAGYRAHEDPAPGATAAAAEPGGEPVHSRCVIRLEDAPDHFGRQPPASLTVIQDRLQLEMGKRARLVEACEQAYHFGKGHLTIHWLAGRTGGTFQLDRSQRFSKHFHCATCDLEYREPSPALFSFNHPLGACPTCKGFGRVIQIDYDLAIPDRSLSLNGGAVKPWRTETGAECQTDLARFCRKRRVPMDVPFRDLPEATQHWVINGDPDYGKDAEHRWPRAWYGVKGYFRWLESKAYKMHVRVLLSKYRAYVLCPDCRGNRLQAEALLYRVAEGAGNKENDGGNGTLTLADFYRLPVRDAVRVIDGLLVKNAPKPHEPLGLVLGEVKTRLRYLDEIGLGYLTLDRPTRSLSGGETERVNLTSCLGTRLVNTLYVLDEPSVGLHPRDTARLVRILEGLRDAGNTVVVVEHEEGVMRAADQIVDLGPGHGQTGGDVIFQGDFRSILKADGTLTGAYLSGRRSIEVPQTPGLSSPDTHIPPRSNGGNTADSRRKGGEARPALKLMGASRHNLRNLSVEIPLEKLVCITGVSGSGKSTLVRDLLVPLLAEKLGQTEELAARRDKDTDGGDEEADPGSSAGGDARLTGAGNLRKVVLVDQTPIGRTPRSNPAVYVGAFDDIRELFAQTDEAKRRGYNASSFSFNSAQGQCDRCRGAGFEKIEMQFLSDVFIKCPACNGRRYREFILEVRIQNPESRSRESEERNEGRGTSGAGPGGRSGRGRGRRSTRRSEHGSPNPETGTPGPGLSIADLLEFTVEEAITLLDGMKDSRFAVKAVGKLKLLQELGLGYLQLGQPINTLSGGECQRLKLVSHLADVERGLAGVVDGIRCGILFVFDEPTTGLHFDDVRILLLALRRLVAAGHSVLVVEHHLDVIRNADWVIDLGPGAGEEGGQIVATGTPSEIAGCAGSFTGQALSQMNRHC